MSRQQQDHIQHCRRDGHKNGTFQRSQVALIKHRMVLNVALRQPKVAQLAAVREQPEPLDWLEKQIQVDFALSPEILRISMTGKESTSVLALVDAVREAYLSEVVDKEKKQRQERLDLVTKLYEGYESLLTDKRKNLKALADDLNSSDSKFLAFRLEFSLKETHMLQQELAYSTSRNCGVREPKRPPRS